MAKTDRRAASPGDAVLHRNDAGRTDAAGRLVVVRRLRVLLLTMLACATVVGIGVTARAHSGLAAASPGPGAIVGGEVVDIQMFYGDIITTFDGSITSPSGVDMTATSDMISDIQGLITLTDPITEAGEYTVRHTITSFDDDVVSAAYLFTYDPSAPPTQLLFVPEDEGSVSWIVWVAVGLGVVLIGVLAWRLIAAIRRRSAALESVST